MNLNESLVVRTHERANIPNNMNEIFQAIAREAGLAAEHLAIGASALGKSNYAQQSYYYQAFFALSVGFERCAKLTLLIDYTLEHNGSFPSNDIIRRYGHNIRNLLELTDLIAERRGFKERLPRSLIHNGIIEVLNDFASNITRYYNIEFITGAPNITQRQDPIQDWFVKVITPIINIHRSPRQQKKHEYNARIVNDLLEPFALVRHHAENGNELNTPYKASLQTATINFAIPYTRMYVLQIARFIGNTLSELGYISMSQQIDTIPYLSDFFAIFNNSNAYFKERKTWSIYG